MGGGRKRRMTNKGALALRKICAGSSQGEVRRRVGAPAGVVTRWVSGARRPDAKNAMLLQREYGIDVALWWDEVEDDEVPPRQRITGTDG